MRPTAVSSTGNGDNSSSNKYRVAARPVVLRRRLAGNNGNHGGGWMSRTVNPTFWIGMFMFCLVIAYVIVVISVTSGWAYYNHHAPEPSSSLSSSLSSSTGEVVVNNNGDSTADDTAAAAEAAEAAATSALQKRLQDARIKKEQEVQKKNDSNNNKNPVRLFHLEDPLGHGVDPHVLLPHQGDTEELPLPYKEDIPLEEHPTPDYVLKAFLEPLHLNDWDVKPLPNRTYATAANLRELTFTRLRSCSKLTQQFPVDDHRHQDQGHDIKDESLPTDADPFLPWIHDVFPTADGRFIQFVAQNRRRCDSGKKDTEILLHRQPQAALFQHISLKRVQQQDDQHQQQRYRLASHQDADPDSLATRFICRFKPSMEVTFSTFNLDYDWTAFRKRYGHTFAEEDPGIKSIHTSQLLFRCPVPESLQDTVRTGSSVQNDWASLFLDLIPIRTPPRYGAPHQYLLPRYKEFQSTDPNEMFDPDAVYGRAHVLPLMEDSGRWENIPICKPSHMTYGTHATEQEPVPKHETPVADKSNKKNNYEIIVVPPEKKHRLVSCLWASAGYTTRGNRFAVNDGQRRLLEWITYNKMIGFDHFYIYDNSGAFLNDTSLKSIADLFPDDITYISWPAQICNNNPNNVDSPGERSSQYAAEASCYLRFGPHTQWIGQFDIDEYLVPMADHNNITSLLDELDKEDTRIISFGSWRAWPRKKFIDDIKPIDDPEYCWSKETCFDLNIPMKHTMLQAYNCDRQKPGQKTSQMPAEKQLYRAQYVVQHFVHYSAATVLSEMNRTEFESEGLTWRRRGFPDARQRFGNELKEGLMIHTKAVARQDTAGYLKACRKEYKRGLCRLGIPWPDENETQAIERGYDEDGWLYNCYVNEKVENYLVPKLNKALESHSHYFDTTEEE